MDAQQRGIRRIVAFLAVAGVSGYLASASSYDEDFSDRLLRLKLLAHRLQSKERSIFYPETLNYLDDIADYQASENWRSTLAEYLSDAVLASKNSDNIAGYQGTEEWKYGLSDYLLDPVATTKRVIRWKDGNNFNRRKKAVDDISNMKTKYVEFHQALSAFCTSLATKFQNDAPPELSFVTLLPTVLTPSDTDFVYNDMSNIVKKWAYVKNVTQRTLAKIGRFVKPEYLQWLSGQKSNLEWLIIMVDMSFVALGTEDLAIGSEYVVLSSGIGGVNFGTGESQEKLKLLKKVRDITTMLRRLEAK